MGRIPTAEITVSGKKKIVNADDPRVEKKPAAKSTAKKSND